jgi:hypothetical protein
MSTWLAAPAMKSCTTRFARGRAGGVFEADGVAASRPCSPSNEANAMPPSPPPERQRNSRRFSGWT